MRASYGLGMVAILVCLFGCVQKEKLSFRDQRWERLRDFSVRQDKDIKALKAKVSKLSAEITKLRAELKKTKRLSKRRKNTAKVPLIELPPVGEFPEEGETVADSTHLAVQDYLQAHEDLKNRKFGRAERKLRKFIKENPNHVYRDRAEFLLIENSFLNREYSLALLGARKFELHYPYSLKLPEVIFRLAECYRKLGQKRLAKLSFQRMIREFPSHRQVRLARERIKTL